MPPKAGARELAWHSRSARKVRFGMIAGNHGQKVGATRPGYKRDLTSNDRESFFTKEENGVRPGVGRAAAAHSLRHGLFSIKRRTRRMKSTRPIQGVLIIWAIWEIINGALSTFAPRQGASLVSWAPKSGWTSDLLLMSQQYGMVMFVLGVMYLIVATNPLRYRSLIWVAVAEQAIGIIYALSSFLSAHTLTLPQFLTLAVGNIVIAAIFVLLRPVERPTTPRRAGATA